MIADFFGYQFIQNALIAGSFVAVICGVLGVFLVSKRMSLIGDGLSHTALAGIAIGLFIGKSPLLVTLSVVMLASILILKLTEKAKVYGDSAIGILSAGAISIALILASLAKGFNTDLFYYLFGNILAVSKQEVIISVALSLIILLLIFIFYKQIIATTIDEEHAQTLGINSSAINTLIVMMTACAVVLGIKTAGIMLVSAMIIIPPASAMQIAKNIKQTIFFAGLFGVLSLVIGVLVSFVLDLPASASIIAINIIIFISTLCSKNIKK
ncbi:MAG: metal ABC transporter permease [Elusimicrobiaceae bacterium]|jgi:zinc transport system permease protein|nr:metal ABC transporter permease [Elusimicrobiaceae bacterium]MBT3955303.1 metal ABC transporter permease [Elusimicrobiaceae bacterium]MBT4008439.1 metal ABC transporter permease [Elusimicrobiaceae bacterium]MBT4403248.1 metal ABC transporter permease [Elusimicrobiaceae bacterium]MBT4440168.1 metal ABC transporter permease [Elusimicrobiaceae bacterium]